VPNVSSNTRLYNGYSLYFLPRTHYAPGFTRRDVSSRYFFFWLGFSPCSYLLVSSFSTRIVLDRLCAPLPRLYSSPLHSFDFLLLVCFRSGSRPFFFALLNSIEWIFSRSILQRLRFLFLLTHFLPTGWPSSLFQFWARMGLLFFSRFQHRIFLRSAPACTGTYFSSTFRTAIRFFSLVCYHPRLDIPLHFFFIALIFFVGLVPPWRRPLDPFFFFTALRALLYVLSALHNLPLSLVFRTSATLHFDSWVRVTPFPFIWFWFDTLPMPYYRFIPLSFNSRHLSIPLSSTRQAWMILVPFLCFRYIRPAFQFPHQDIDIPSPYLLLIETVVLPHTPMGEPSRYCICVLVELFFLLAFSASSFDPSFL